MTSRLEDIRSYEIIGKQPEKELDEFTELASIICGTPISLITVLDDQHQWFKSKIGLEINETGIEDSFCQYALHKPNEVLVVNDVLNDARFSNSILVTEDPKIRFYAGAPLLTSKKNVIGTLCIIDKKPREITKDQERALQILAKKAMDKIESLKLVRQLTKSIDFNADRLIKLTENLPIGIFEMLVSESGEIEFTFLSKGMKKLHPHVNFEDWLKDASIGFTLIHPKDVEGLQNAIFRSIETGKEIYHEYRVKNENQYHWHAISGYPCATDTADAKIHGSFTDVSHHFEYASAIEQISFDISHVLRRPITSMLGVVNLINTEKDLSSSKLKEYSGYINRIADEMEAFTHDLNQIYAKKKHSITVKSKSNIH